MEQDKFNHFSDLIDNDELIKFVIKQKALECDLNLIEALYNDEKTRAKFFVNLGETTVFDYKKFVDFVDSESFSQNFQAKLKSNYFKVLDENTQSSSKDSAEYFDETNQNARKNSPLIRKVLINFKKFGNENRTEQNRTEQNRTEQNRT
ncbi:MAG: site-specific DNA-methyltransferase, partial [Campylobacter sp.]|nr:site-specific DNA-methyltransferase [Campylobacter sp.]